MHKLLVLIIATGVLILSGLLTAAILLATNFLNLWHFVIGTAMIAILLFIGSVFAGSTKYSGIEKPSDNY